jgi:circadian clock protein KaiC
VAAPVAEGVLTGSARLAQEAKEQAATLLREQEIQRKHSELDRKRQAVEARIAALRCRLAADKEEPQLMLSQARGREEQLERNRLDMARSRTADPNEVKGL